MKLKIIEMKINDNKKEQLVELAEFLGMAKFCVSFTDDPKAFTIPCSLTLHRLLRLHDHSIKEIRIIF